MAVDLDNARMVVLDVVERCADLEEVFTAEVMAATQRWRFEGPTVPPVGHPFRADFESWAESAGCGDGRRGFPAPDTVRYGSRICPRGTLRSAGAVPDDGPSMTADGSDTCQCGHERAQHRWVRGAYWSGCNACECWFFLRPATVVLNWTGYEVVDGIVMSPAVAKAYRSWRSDDGEDDR